MHWTRGHLAWVVAIVLAVAVTTALLQGATTGAEPSASSTVAMSPMATAQPGLEASPSSTPVTQVATMPSGTIIHRKSVTVGLHPTSLPTPLLTSEDWARPFDIEGVRLGMARDDAWKNMGERSRWRRSMNGPLEVWTSLDLPARRVVYSGDGRVEALSGMSLGHQGTVIFTGDVEQALAYLGPPDLKGNGLMDETWIWNRHGATGFIGLHVKSGRVVISRSEDRVL